MNDTKKCPNCKTSFTICNYNGERQVFCTAIDCKIASRVATQRRYRLKMKLLRSAPKQLPPREPAKIVVEAGVIEQTIKKAEDLAFFCEMSLRDICIMLQGFMIMFTHDNKEKISEDFLPAFLKKCYDLASDAPGCLGAQLIKEIIHGKTPRKAGSTSASTP